MLFALAVMAATASACLTKAPTTLETSLSGGGKEGVEITVPEGTGIKDQATLSGENAAKATGSIEYFVYSDSKCKELVAKAGKFEFTGGKVPASEEEKLEAGTAYRWQAVYSGDSIDEGSTSPCNEISTVKAKTTLSTTLSGGGEEGAEVVVPVEVEVKDKAALSGTKSSTATGTVKYAVYKDKECKEFIGGAGEVSVSEGNVPASSGETLPQGIYYWQATYEGDSLHEKSVSVCGTEKLTVPLRIESCMGEGTECKLSSAGTTFTTASEGFVLSSGEEGEKEGEEEGEPTTDECNMAGSGEVVDPTSEGPGDQAELLVTSLEFSECTGPALTAKELPWTVSADLSAFEANREFEWDKWELHTLPWGCTYITKALNDLVFKKWDKSGLLLDLGHVVFKGDEDKRPWYCRKLRSVNAPLEVRTVEDPSLSGATSLIIK